MPGDRPATFCQLGCAPDGHTPDELKKDGSTYGESSRKRSAFVLPAPLFKSPSPRPYSATLTPLSAETAPDSIYLIITLLPETGRVQKVGPDADVKTSVS